MSTIEKVPWFCREEWEFCRNNLFGSDIGLKKKALEHLYVWKTRCSNLHMGIECTLVLIDTTLRDSQSDGNENWLPNRMSLELTYSMAVTKFVNFVTDSSFGNRSTFMLQDLAKELGIPAWIINLRHKAAHDSSCPSLPLLREAVEFCLKWLYNEYWSSDDFENICSRSENSISDVETCLNVHLIIKNYMLKDCEKISEISSEDKQKITRFLLKTSETTQNDYFDEWSLKDVCKITIEKLSKLIRKYPRKGELLVDKLLEENTLLNSNNVDDAGRLEESYVHTWNEILSVLCVSSKCYHFLRSLVEITVDQIESIIRKKCAAIHLNEIFINILKQNRTTKVKSKGYQSSLQLRRPQLLDQETSALLKIALQQPSDYVVIYLRNLLEIQNPTLESSKIDKLLQLVDVHNGYSNLEEVDVENDLKRSLKSLITPQDVIMAECNGAESIPSSNRLLKMDDSSGSWNWSQTPIGILPWQQDFKPWLKLYGI